MRLFLLSLLGLGACGGGGSGDHEMDVVFDACETLVLLPLGGTSRAEQESLADAVVMWNALGTTKLTLETLTEAPRLHIRFVDDTVVFGQYDDELGEVIVSRDIN